MEGGGGAKVGKNLGLLVYPSSGSLKYQLLVKRHLQTFNDQSSINTFLSFKYHAHYMYTIFSISIQCTEN